MTHLFVCREFPPAPYPPGGIGTYVEQMSRLLAERGETVHVIAHRWTGAPDRRAVDVDGRRFIHRVALDEPLDGADTTGEIDARIRQALLSSSAPAQTFAWQAALLAERLVDEEGIDCIESQEWEAPLYYFQLRRTLGLSRTTRRPPCVVHVHSPSERIYTANAWDTSVADYAPTVSMEAATLRAADALLCPSHYVATETVEHYGLDPGRMHVIPYPMGLVPSLARDSVTWSSGSICHVGRLEGRKGVIECADAAALIKDRSFRITFVGGDTPVRVTGGETIGDVIRHRLDRDALKHIDFHGTRNRDGVMSVLAQSSAAIVPSRWENFPYSCIEAMATGLPIIASPNGGMRELIEDGVSGWIASSTRPEDLAVALTRALETPADVRAAMGAAALARVRSVCANERIVARHLELKRKLTPPTTRGRVSHALDSRMALMLLEQHSPDDVAACLEGIANQTTAADVICVMARRSSELATACVSKGWMVFEADDVVGRQAVEALETLLASRRLTGVALVDAAARIEPAFISTCATVLSGHDEIGVVAGWTADQSGRIHVPQDPSVPHRADNDALTTHVAVGGAALSRALSANSASATLSSVISNVLRDTGAMVYPGVLATAPAGIMPTAAKRRYSSMARGVQRLHTGLVRWILDGSADDRRALIAQALRHPARSAQQLAAPLTRLFKDRLRGGLANVG